MAHAQSRSVFPVHAILSRAVHHDPFVYVMVSASGSIAVIAALLAHAMLSNCPLVRRGVNARRFNMAPVARSYKPTSYDVGRLRI
ncbi:hypothetical protein [Sphingomonas sp. NFR15]|uniref:hypothetical protein n=1 Tax=Sphingomonas sp. NFR15 TaxID=1566282 RepID=UPI0015A3338F|nr:hypothetical protein [Sphingomonas sp. NFR15]